MDPALPLSDAEAPEATLARLEALISEHTSDEASAGEVARLHLRVAQIYLGQREAQARALALDHLWACWRLQPGELDARLVLISCLEADGKVGDLTELYRRSAERCEDVQEQNALLSRAAELHHRAGEIDEALRLFRRMAEYGGHRLVEQRVRALRALIQSLESEGTARAPQRLEALALLLSHLRGGERFACALELARAHTDAGEPDAAHAAFQQALALQPAAPEALEPALRHLESRGELGEVVRLLSAAIQASVAPRPRAQLLRRLARLFEERLADPGQAVQLWWHAWEEAPDPGDPVTLKRLLAALQQWDSYLQVLLRELQRTTSCEDKLATLRELAAFQREVLHDQAAAAQSYGAILQLAPEDEEALTARVELFEAQGQEEAAAIALRRHASRTRDAARRGELLRRLARLELRRPARGGLLQVLRGLDPVDPVNRELVREVRGQVDAERESRLHLELGLLLLGMARQAGEDTAAVVELALELSRFCLRSGERGHASDCLRQALELQPGHAEARAALDGLGEEERSSDPTPEELSAQAEAVSGERPLRAVRLLLQAAQVVRQRAAEEAGAAAGPAASSLSAPQGREDRGPEAARAAELLRRAQALCPLDAEPELELIEEELRASGLDADLAELLRRRSEHELHPPRRKRLLLATAQLLRDRLDDAAGAVEVLEDALALDPLDTETAEQIRALHGQLGNHAALARVLEELLAATSGRARVPLLEELGRLYAEVLGDETSALGRYGELLALVPDHPRALECCRRHDEAAGDHRSVAVLICRAAEAAEDPLQRAELHREIAGIAERKLEDLDFAIAQWRRVIDLCPADTAPRAELRRLLALAGRWREVETALLSDISRSVRPEEKVPLYLELATLARERLQDDRLAAGYLRLALQLAPSHREILTQLELIYERLGQWRELAAALRRHAEVETDAEERLRLLHRAARVLLVRLRREDEALAICQQLRARHPGDRVTATLMGEIFTRRGLWRELLALLQAQLEVESDPTELSRLHLELGHLLADRLGDAAGAAAQFEHAMELDGGRGEVLPTLRRFYEAQGRWEQLVELIGRRVAAETISPREQSLACCEIGRIRELHQQDTAGARESYERALHLDPECLPALSALRALALQHGQWREAVTLGRRELPLTEDPAARAAILIEIGEVLHEQLGRASAAAEALEEALGEHPDNLQATARLAIIYFEAEDWERAARLLERVVEVGDELPDQHVSYYRLGLASERLGQEEEAFNHYVKSFGREPMYLPTLDRLVELCYSRRQWDNTLRIATALVSTYEAQKTPEELAELHLRIGLCELHLAERDLAVTKLQDMVLEPGELPSTPDEAWLDAAECWAATPLGRQLLVLVPPEVLARAVRSMERVMMQVPDEPRALQVLAALSLVVGENERALRYLERVIDTAGAPPALGSALLVCAGDVASQLLFSPQRAEAYYRRAVALQPASELARRRLGAFDDTSGSGPSTIPLQLVEGTLRASPPPIPQLRRSGTQPLPLRIISPLQPTPPRTPASVPRPAPRSKPRKPGDPSSSE